MNVLVVSPFDADHATLKHVLPNKWVLSHAADLRSALRQLRMPGQRFPLVVCERDLASNSWRELLEQVVRMAVAPFLIVSSRFADEKLWAEALNVGAYDVLAKPFDPDEVNRVLSAAWARWSRSFPWVVEEALAGSGSTPFALQRPGM